MKGGKCPGCGAPHEGDSSSSFCERCLLQAALGNREEEIHDELLQIASPEERSLYLEEICGDDPQLRDRVQNWLNDQHFDFPGSLKSTVGLPGPGAPPLIGGRYHLIREIGEGGFGTVYLAEQTSPVRRKVAVKILKLGMDTRQVVARFELERQALALMDHPGIAKVLDGGATETGRPYFVMELVRGRPITQFCQEEKLTIPERLGLFEKVCQAVQHAHQKGIIHRDLKPSNILVTAEAGLATPKVIDFGIAKALQSELEAQTLLTQEHQLLGTPAYVSPEQATLGSADIDTRSDIYSLGVLLYELLTGSTPFDSKELVRSGFDEMRRTIRETQPLRPSLRLAQVDCSAEVRIHDPSQKIDSDLDCIVMKCLAKDRNERYATANGVAADIKRYLGCQPVIARPPSRLYEFRKTMRRHKVGFAATAGVILALAIGFGVSAWQAAVAMRARNALRGQIAATNKARKAAETAAQAELAQRTRAESLLRESKAVETELIFARGLEIAERGDVDYGMLWMLEALKRAPADATAFADMVRRNLAGWSQLVPRLVQIWHSRGQHAFSPNGALLAIDLDDALHIIDARSGADLIQPLTWPGQIMDAIAFHPTRPEVAVAFRPRDNDAQTASAQITVVNAHTGGLLFPPVRHQPGVVQLLFSRDGSDLFVVGRMGRNLAVRNARTGQQIRSVNDPVAPRRNFYVSLDGGQLLAEDRSAILDAGTLAIIAAQPPVQPLRVHLLRSDSAELVIHAPPGAEAELHFPPGYDAPEPVIKLGNLWVSNMAADGSLALSGPQQLFDFDTRRPLWSPLRDPWGLLGSDPSVQVEPTARGRWQLPRPLSRPAAPVRQTNPAEALLNLHRSGSEAIQFSAAGQVFIHRDDAIHDSRPMIAARLRDGRTGFPISRPLRQRGSAMYDVALSRDGRFAATTTFTSLGDWQLYSGETTIWDARTGKRLHGPLAPNLMMRALEFSPDGGLLAASTTGRICFWNTATGQPDGPEIVTPGTAIALVFSPDGKTLAAGLDHGGGTNSYALLYDLKSRQPLAGEFPGGSSDEWGVYLAFTPDGQSLVLGQWTSGFCVLDLHSMRPRYPPIPCATTVYGIAISANSSRFALTELQTGVSRVFDLSTGRQIGRGMQHSVSSQAIALNADGTLLVTGSMEGTVRLWDVGTSQPLGPPLAHRYAIWDVRFSPDGRSFSSTDRRGITKQWPVPEPARGDPADLEAELEMWSRTRLADGIPAQISNQEWQQRKAVVDRFPAGQVWLPDPIPDPIWHEARATDAEGDGNWYLAWWHLKQLVAARPEDWHLHARLGRVNVLRGELATAAADFATVEQLAGRNSLLDWLAQCAYTCREDKAWKSAVYFLKELSVAEPKEWQWPADQEEALTELGQKEEAHDAFVKALQLCHDRTIPKLADELVQKGDWAALQKELGRAERVGWLSLEDWKLWVRSARQLKDALALRSISARFQERAGPNCPLAMEIGLEPVSPSTRSTSP